MIVDANIFQPLVDVVNAVLKFFHDNAGLSWGGAIIALTVLTRAILIPLTYRQLKGMRALQALQPQIKEIQAKYKNDRQRMQQVEQPWKSPGTHVADSGDDLQLVLRLCMVQHSQPFT